MKVTIVVGILGALALCSHQATAKPMDQIPEQGFNAFPGQEATVAPIDDEIQSPPRTPNYNNYMLHGTDTTISPMASLTPHSAKSYQSTDTDELVGHEARQKAEEITQAYQTALSNNQASAAVNLIRTTLTGLIQEAQLDLPIRSDYFDMLRTHLGNFTDVDGIACIIMFLRILYIDAMHRNDDLSSNYYHVIMVATIQTLEDNSFAGELGPLIDLAESDWAELYPDNPVQLANVAPTALFA